MKAVLCGSPAFYFWATGFAKAAKGIGVSPMDLATDDLKPLIAELPRISAPDCTGSPLLSPLENPL